MKLYIINIKKNSTDTTVRISLWGITIQMLIYREAKMMNSSHPIRCFCRELEHTISLFEQDKLTRTRVFHSVHVVFGESTSSKQRQIK